MQFYMMEQIIINHSLFNIYTFFIIANTSVDYGLSDISSEPTKVCICFKGKKNCTRLTVQQDLFPGETFKISLVAVGQLDGTVPATIHSQFATNSTAHFGPTGKTFKQPTEVALPFTILSSLKVT